MTRVSNDRDVNVTLETIGLRLMKLMLSQTLYSFHSQFDIVLVAYTLVILTKGHSSHTLRLARGNA